MPTGQETEDMSRGWELPRKLGEEAQLTLNDAYHKDVQIIQAKETVTLQHGK